MLKQYRKVIDLGHR